MSRRALTVKKKKKCGTILNPPNLKKKELI